MRAGRQLARNGKCPLMYEWHGKKYWGAAHGLAGIMLVLMDMELKPDEVEDVKGTLRYMMENRFPSSNYPSSEGSENDRLVHWCHGAPGVALMLVKAAEVTCFILWSQILSSRSACSKENLFACKNVWFWNCKSEDFFNEGWPRNGPKACWHVDVS